MAHDSGKEKQQAHELIERLTAGQVSAVVGLLEAMLDPVSRAIANAPVDEESISPEGQKALDQVREWLEHNRAIPHEQLLADLGITPEEIERFKQTKGSRSCGPNWRRPMSAAWIGRWPCAFSLHCNASQSWARAT